MSYPCMSKISLFYCLFFGLLAQIGWGNSLLSSVATQEEIDQDGFLQSTARNLKQSDIVLTVIIYKVVKTDQGTTHYARVIQSLRGDIPVEALIKWSGYANKLPVGTPEKRNCIPVAFRFMCWPRQRMSRIWGKPRRTSNLLPLSIRHRSFWVLTTSAIMLIISP